VEGGAVAMVFQKAGGVFYLDQNKLSFYSDNKVAIPSCEFPQDSVRDLEIIDIQKLNTLISTFIQVNALTPLHSIMVISRNAVFEKDFSVEEQKENIVSSIQYFLDAIPFKNVMKKMFRLEKIMKVIGVNKDFYEPVKDILVKHGFPIKLIIPDFVGGVLFAQGMTTDAARWILKNSDSFRQYSLLEEEVISQKKEVQNNNNKNPSLQKRGKRRLYLFVGVFAVLVIILIIMIVL